MLVRSKSDYRDFLCCHVWGCPVFVLEPKLQNYQNLPKWNQRARLGQFLGFSDEHLSLVSNVQHISTGYIYPQFHLVYDDSFKTFICQVHYDSTIEFICSDIFDINKYWYSKEEFCNAGIIFIGCHFSTVSSQMGGDDVIGSKIQRDSKSGQKIGFARAIEQHQRYFR